MSFASLVAIGRVVKPQGRKGEVLVEPFSDRPLCVPTCSSTSGTRTISSGSAAPLPFSS